MSLTIEYGQHTAEWYDLLYGHRDIDGTIAQVLELLQPEPSAPYRLLDFGCGTASHALALAQAGLEVTGCDPSNAMINVARRKIMAAGVSLDLILGSTPELLKMGRNASSGVAEADQQQQTFESVAPKYDRRVASPVFDGAISLFNVLNCMSSAAEMGSHVAALGRMLAANGRMVLEVWNGAAVLGDQPRHKTRRVRCSDHPGHILEQRLTPVLDALEQRCTLQYTTRRCDPSGACLESHREIQVIHFLTPVHYRQIFSDAGFKTLAEFPAGKPHLALTGNHWFAGYLLQRRPQKGSGAF